jgi:hypothetical protein
VTTVDVRELLAALRVAFESDGLLRDAPAGIVAPSVDELIADIEEAHGVEAARDARRLVATVTAWSATPLQTTPG